jgi:Flp pilus assembly protein TadG
VHAPSRRRGQLGQSLAEFAISSVVLVLLFGGLVDLTRAIHYADVLQSAVREGIRYGSIFNAGSDSNPHLDDADIKSVVDSQLAAGGLPGSILKNAGTCPAGLDNSQSNPPYGNASFPAVGNQPWLYICYAGGTTDHPTTPATGLGGQDLDVVLVMAYAPMTAAIPTPLGGNLGLATNLHARIQGG